MNILSKTLVAIAVLGSASAFAQTKIDQQKALAGGITAGDAAGFPVTLSHAGSYRLASNLVVPAGVSGIEITASNVTLDLNGYSITGPMTCTAGQNAVTCTGGAPALARGIDAGSASGVTIRNGVVQGFQQHGIVYAQGGLIQGMLVRSNAGTGITGLNTVAAVLQVQDTRMELNAGGGISTQALIERCSAGQNGATGIYNAGNGAVTMHSSAHRNFGYGIQGGKVLGNTSYSNTLSNYQDVTSMGSNAEGSNIF